MAVVNALGVVLSTAFAVMAIIFGVASSMSLGASDPKERKDATISAFWSLVMFAFCAAAILSLTGCSTLHYAECIARDNTSRPCNY